ncbi:hypothetical protein SAMN05443543_105225 [Flavobacterium flevense]|nr:hypothetical protein SAMN05443543_105225 [Flavobacterium flevense]
MLAKTLIIVTIGYDFRIFKKKQKKTQSFL